MKKVLILLTYNIILSRIRYTTDKLLKVEKNKHYSIPQIQMMSMYSEYSGRGVD